MHKFINFIKEFRIPSKRETAFAVKTFSKKELITFVILLLISLSVVIAILLRINNYFMVQVPASGGTINEGIIGMPVLVNPVLATSDADRDLTSIVYSGLMRKNSNGEFIKDMAESYEISKDGTMYTFILKDNLEFHDGTNISADDVIFTIEKIKDPLIKSPKKASWDGVEVIKKDDLTVVFKLKEPYISFMDNTTVGIIPKALWKNVNTQEFSLSKFNIKAIGSGPYKITSVSKNKDGVPEKYELKYFKNFALGIPHIKRINFFSFSNEKDLIKALENGSIDQAGGISPENVLKIKTSNYKIHTATLSRSFSLFLNSNKNKIFEDQSVIKAFDIALNRKFIVDEVLKGYGSTIHNPVPKYITEEVNNQDFTDSQTEEAIQILEKAGWHKGEDGVMVKGGTTTKTITKKVGKKTVTQKVSVNNGAVTKLSFSIITGNTPELKKTVEIIKSELEKIGAVVNTDKVYETGQLSQTIRNRDYESLFFGQIINHESDLYSFWHSSQRTDPGLNIAMYNNKSIDTLLESIQKTLTLEDRLPKYKNLINEFDKNPQALMIYSPQYIYITSKTVNNIQINTLSVSSDRFASIYDWYAKEDLVWKIFAK